MLSWAGSPLRAVGSDPTKLPVPTVRGVEAQSRIPPTKGQYTGPIRARDAPARSDESERGHDYPTYMLKHSNLVD